MKTAVIIPARMASTRFPGKPLVDMLGIPMIEHVRRRALLASSVDIVAVATCDREIWREVEKYGGRAIMTASTHDICTDRVAEAVKDLDIDVVINLQGDEPLVHPDLLEQLVYSMQENPELPCSNLMTEIDNEEEYLSPDVVKVTVDLQGNAIYFSREPIPSTKKAGNQFFKKYKQLGIIAFRKAFLEQFTSLARTPLEQIESVDMLRIIEHGYNIRMVESKFVTKGVDTPQDREKAISLLKEDPLTQQYLRV